MLTTPLSILSPPTDVLVRYFSSQTMEKRGFWLQIVKNKQSLLGWAQRWLPLKISIALFGSEKSENRIGSLEGFSDIMDLLVRTDQPGDPNFIPHRHTLWLFACA